MGRDGEEGRGHWGLVCVLAGYGGSEEQRWSLRRWEQAGGSQSGNAAEVSVCLQEGCVSWLWKLLVGWEVQGLGECSSHRKVGWDTGSSCKEPPLPWSACGPQGTLISLTYVPTQLSGGSPRS